MSQSKQSRSAKSYNKSAVNVKERKIPAGPEAGWGSHKGNCFSSDFGVIAEQAIRDMEISGAVNDEPKLAWIEDDDSGNKLKEQIKKALKEEVVCVECPIKVPHSTGKLNKDAKESKLREGTGKPTKPKGEDVKVRECDVGGKVAHTCRRGSTPGKFNSRASVEKELPKKQLSATQSKQRLKTMVAEKMQKNEKPNTVKKPEATPAKKERPKSCLGKRCVDPPKKSIERVKPVQEELSSKQKHDLAPKPNVDVKHGLCAEKSPVVKCDGKVKGSSSAKSGKGSATKQKREFVAKPKPEAKRGSTLKYAEPRTIPKKNKTEAKNVLKIDKKVM